MKFKEKITKGIEFIEKQPITFLGWLVSILTVVLFREISEILLFGLADKKINGLFFQIYSQVFSFFFLTYLVFFLFLNWIIGGDFRKIAKVLLFGFWLIIFPPFIDQIIFHGRFESFYLFASFRDWVKNFFLFFGPKLNFGITFGVRLEIFISIVAMSFYIWIKKGLKKALTGGLLAYFIFYLIGSFPTIITMLVFLFQKGTVFSFRELQVAQYFITKAEIFGLSFNEFDSGLFFRLSVIYGVLIVILLFVFQYFYDKKKLLALIFNIRYPQMVFNVGIFLIGMGLGSYFFPENVNFNLFSVFTVFCLIFSIFLAWLQSVVVNDICDLEIDKLTNPQRPLVKKLFNLQEYRIYGITFSILAIFLATLVGIKFSILIIGYQALTYVYSAYPLRIKKYPIIASFFSAFASLIFLFMGYILISNNSTFENFPWRIFFMLLVTYASVIPIKDFKDIEGDRKNEVFTLPVIFGEKKARLLIGSFLLLSYFLSVYIIRESKLFAPALFLGSISFFLVNNQKNNTNRLNWMVLFLVTIYLGFILKYVFFD